MDKKLTLTKQSLSINDNDAESGSLKQYDFTLTIKHSVASFMNPKRDHYTYIRHLIQTHFYAQKLPCILYAKFAAASSPCIEVPPPFVQRAHKFLLQQAPTFQTEPKLTSFFFVLFKECYGIIDTHMHTTFYLYQ